MTSFTASKSRLFLISAIALSTEVVLIRWMSAEIRMFAYLKNFTLFACFLGLGLGMMRRKRSRPEKLLPVLIATIVLILAFAPQLHLTRLFFPDVGVYQWGGNLHSPQLLPAARSLPVFGALLRHVPDASVPWLLGGLALTVGAAIFCLVLAIFYRIGVLVGECLEAAGPPLQAYTLNLAGSLGGHSRIYGAGILFIAAVGLGSARIRRTRLFFPATNAGRFDSGERARRDRCDRAKQSHSVVALLPHNLCAQSGRGLSPGCGP
jgi:hypothetical protein